MGVTVRKAQFFVVLAGGLLMSSASVLAQNAPAPAPAAAPVAPAPSAAPVAPAHPATPEVVKVVAPPQDDPNEVICKSGEPVIGSRFPGPRTCYTRREWAQVRKDSQDALFHQQMERAATGQK